MKDTRAALVEHFKEGHFVHPAALFVPDAAGLAEWLGKNAVQDDDEDDGTPAEQDERDGDVPVEPAHDFVDDDVLSEGYRDAAE